jgi:hypothetical protein
VLDNPTEIHLESPILLERVLNFEKFLELCAASTAGELSCEEEQTLEQHLAVCASCRQAKYEFEKTVQKTIAALADDLASHAPETEDDWSVEKAEEAFFKRLESHRSSCPTAQGALERPESEPTGYRFTYRPSRIPWATLWMPVAACALLAIALGIVVYRSGLKRGADSAQKETVPASLSVSGLEEQISDSGHERAQLLTSLADDDRALKDFKREVATLSDEIKRLKGLRDISIASGQNSAQSRADDSVENSRRDAELAAAQANLQQLQAKAARGYLRRRTNATEIALI